MTEPRRWHSKLALYAFLPALLAVLAGCGGGSSSNSGSTILTAPVNNTIPIEVNLGPANNYTNGAFADVTICVPGTSNCQIVPNVLVDTGSEGLRLLSSAVTLSLPPETDSGNNGLQECTSFADGSYLWGPVVSADVQLAGEKASSVPIQLISASAAYPVPNQCTSAGGRDQNTVASLGANGILGIGNFQQDCGSQCTSASTAPPLYYLCPNSVCQVVSVPLTGQVQNPVWLFPQDNNGVLISLPSVPADGAPTVSGSLIFGIGTQSDNALGNAAIYTTNANGDFQTSYNGIAYGNSYIDSGSDAIYFLDSTTLGIPDCSDNPGWYCPSSIVNYTVTNSGLNGATGTVSFSIANADELFTGNGGGNAAFNDLGGDSGTSTSTDYFDFGMPFFYGRNVFIGIENQPGPNGSVGPYWAY
jgi:hypothetical protein